MTTMTDELWNRAEEIQKDFVYELTCDGGDVTRYYCHAPKSSNWCFELIFGGFGIYVGGDLCPGLSWRVARGIKFLAGSDLHYIHSKLSSTYYDLSEFDPEVTQSMMAELLENGEIDRNTYDEVCAAENESEVYEIIGDEIECPHEYVHMRPKSSVMFALCMVCVAARKISEGRVLVRGSCATGKCNV